MDFIGELQQAYWRGVPFKVRAASVRKGRKVAIHDYPFRDGGWAEDMGRAQQVYSFIGYLIGDTAPLMQLALDVACEIPGPGILVHPSLGAVNVSLLSATSAVRSERMGAITVAFEFIEQGALLFPSILTQTIANALSSVSLALPAIAVDLVGFAVMAAAAGLAASQESGAVVGSYVASCTGLAADPGALVAMATALPPPDSNTTYGRFSGGSATTLLPVGTTVVSLQGQIAAQRSAVAAAGAAAVLAAQNFSASTGTALVTAISALIEATRLTMTNPADQIRALLPLCAFSYTDTFSGTGLSGDVATVRNAIADACRRATVLSLVNAAAAYQPVSYNDAANMRALIAAAIDVEITAAGDAGQDATYMAFKAMRAAMVADLTARGATLPSVETVTLPRSLPSLVVAYRLYQDASRSDQIAAEAVAQHPAFLPNVMQVLAA